MNQQHILPNSYYDDIEIMPYCVVPATPPSGGSGGGGGSDDDKFTYFSGLYNLKLTISINHLHLYKGGSDMGPIMGNLLLQSMLNVSPRITFSEMSNDLGHSLVNNHMDAILLKYETTNIVNIRFYMNNLVRFAHKDDYKIREMHMPNNISKITITTKYIQDIYLPYLDSALNEISRYTLPEVDFSLQYNTSERNKVFTDIALWRLVGITKE